MGIRNSPGHGRFIKIGGAGPGAECGSAQVYGIRAGAYGGLQGLKAAGRA